MFHVSLFVSLQLLWPYGSVVAEVEAKLEVRLQTLSFMAVRSRQKMVRMVTSEENILFVENCGA